MMLPPWAVKSVAMAAALGAWFWTQSLIARRPFPEDGLGDRIHGWTGPLNEGLHARPRLADGILIASSAGIDLAGLFLLASALFGPSLRPFLGLLILFALRQLCQGLCALPAPRGMIWRHPGFPSLLVTYGTATDLFFSGHTAVAVLGAAELGAQLGAPGWVAGILLATLEAAVVLILRAHYTMDVFTGAVTALGVWTLASRLAPAVDAWVSALAR
ncbi:MAG: hypothetical protein HY823_01200 [Acidobacteria bacterium]|nr:hypothetical protein [Acidobacteriota bacterium]